MTVPRLEVRLDRIRDNSAALVERLAPRGIGVTGVTKATLGSPEIAHEMLLGGVRGLGESRIENIETLRRAGVTSAITLIRSPMPSQAERVVTHADTSLNTELDVIDRLSVAARAQQRTHGVVLMVELGDLREGIMPGDLTKTAHQVARFPNIALRGIGTNLACQNGASPDARNMAELSSLATSLESDLGVHLTTVWGNSANLDWALAGQDVGRINDLRLGESILLGRETLRRHPIEGLHTDAVVLVGEVIESKRKPMQAWGTINQTAFGALPTSDGPAPAAGTAARAIVALGRQDVDPDGLEAPPGMKIVGASSDHLIVDAGASAPTVGAEVRFQLDYGALLRAMTSPFVTRVFLWGDDASEPPPR